MWEQTLKCGSCHLVGYIGQTLLNERFVLNAKMRVNKIGDAKQTSVICESCASNVTETGINLYCIL